ncbi:MAG: non-canonical purine NTP pyrophosphatase [Patescibacteria group bacterium]
MKILLATHNKGKIRRYKSLFSCFSDLELISLEEMGIRLKVDEPFNSPAENSVHKAREYGNFSNLPTIAIDEAVLTNFLPDNEQPGVFVRRLKKGAELNDQEVLTTWKEIFSTYPNQDLKFIWDFRMSYYEPITKKIKTARATQIDSVAKNFSTLIDPGYPMSSFLIPEGLNTTYSELTIEEYLSVDKINLKSFINFMDNILHTND